jgi:thioredoxin reductase (NADPH)
MINSTAELENYPGMKRVEGMTLGRSFREHAEMFGPEFRDSRVKGVLLGRTDDKVVCSAKGNISVDALIIATGTSILHVGCKGEERFAGRGVSYCAVCDGAFYEDLPVAVIGGGNAALEEADYLTRFASKVYLIHRRDEFRADKTAVDRIMANPKIELALGCVVDEITGDEMVEGVILKNVKTQDKKNIDAKGVFIFVGQKPEAGFLDECGEIKRTRDGWIVTDEKMETSVEGVFAAGDVRDKFLRQAVTAASDGAIAAMAAYEYISNMNYLNSALSGKPHMYALLISGIEPGHLALARDMARKFDGVSVIDLYRASRVRDKLGVKELPSMIEISEGSAARVSPVSSVENIAIFLTGGG